MVPSTQRGQPKTILPINTQASHYKWLVAAIVLIAGATNTFAGNSINLAVPRLMAYFGTDLATAQWLSTALGTLIVFRLLQGLALGPMEGITAVILVEAFPPHQRGLALGLRAIGWSASQVRMGQGLLGVVRNIGGSLGVTVTSVFFEQRRAAHQLLAYDEYATGTPAHGAIMQALQHALHEAGIVGTTADRTALGAIRREMDVEAIAGGFRESFLLLALFFILGCLPLLCLLVLRIMERRHSGNGPKPDASSAH